VLKHLWNVDLRSHRHAGAECNLGKLRCDTQGCLYIADPVEKAVHKFDSEGNLRMRFSGRGNKNLRQPQDVAIDGRGNVFVADSSLVGVVKFSRSGRWEGSFPTEVPPIRIAIDHEDSLYLHALTPQGLLHKYTSQGARLFSFCRGLNAQLTARIRAPGLKHRGVYPDYLNDVGSVEVDSRNRPYFAPKRIYHVQRFTPAGRPTLSFRRRIRERPVTVIVDAKKDVAWTIVTLDIAISKNQNRLYVLRARLREGRSLVDVWSMKGEYHKELLFDHPANSIACDHRDNVYLLHTNMAQGTASLLRYSLSRHFTNGS